MNRIENFYKRARTIIESVYETDTDTPLEDTIDALTKEFETPDTFLHVLNWYFDDYEPDGIADDCLEIGKRYKIIDHTEVVLCDFNNIFVLVLTEKGDLK